MTQTYDIKIDPKVFNKAYIPYLEDMTPLQISYGGSSSGKSVFFVAQRTIYDMMKGGRNYLVTRQVARTIRNSVYNEILKIISDWGVGDLFSVNKSDMVITCSNGYQILFCGLDDVDKLKSITPMKGVITDVVIEEGTETEKASIKQLEKRLRGGSENTPKRMTMLFNPILQTHWIYKDYFESIAWADTQTEYRSDTVVILKTTYKDNKFLTAQDIARLENETDSYFYNVYTLGNWGVLGHVIFTNWKVADLSDPSDPYYLPVEQRTNRKNGLDFGFSSDPAALGVSHYNKTHKTIYVYDELYETGLTNDLLAIEVMRKIGSDRLVCDSAEPKSIVELQKYGVNAVGAKKGKDSVNFGIDWLKQQTIIVDKRCINARNELQTYKYKEDAGGNALKDPVDKNNHFIDGGLRYAYEDEMVGFSPSKVVAFAG
jgi:phage terminase large subunit